MRNANKTTRRYHFTRSSMALHKRQAITSAGEGVEKSELLYKAGGKEKRVEMVWKTVWHFLKTLNIESPQGPAQSFYPQVCT